MNVSAITLSPHLGAHADAPLHYGRDAAAIGAVDLDPFLGPLPRHPRDRQGAADHESASRACRRESAAARAGADLRQGADANGTDHFAAFAPDTIAWLASLGVRLVGIDIAVGRSGRQQDARQPQQLLAHDLRVLENLVLDDVDAGDYELIALPLKLTTACASPVRAVLRSL